MKLFWRDQLPLILFYLLQMLLIPLLYWLSGEGRPITIVLYGLALSSAVLTLYLVFRYTQLRAFYSRLEGGGDDADPLAPMGGAPLAEAAHNLRRRDDRIFREKLYGHSARIDRHIEFINRWVHQMKTPISVIQLTLKDLDGPAADSIEDELERLRKGLETVLYTSRLDRYEDDLHIQPVALRQAISETVAENRRLFIRKGVLPDIRVEESVRVYSDAKWLRFILAQIVTNAVNYSEGSGKTVSFTVRPQDRRLVLEIADQGIGISPEDIKRVFNPYFTGDQGRHYRESTGMGLYLVKEISDRLGHSVGLESKLNEGTVVRLTFAPAPSD
ncbi:sensor histidine kinase [Paenibacillus sp. CN-4]|uniref:sensor histidine kinase n=1 Tax=Paenibacillus nanchangensis TaxID=3348343 RepID=UPI00397B60B2